MLQDALTWLEERVRDRAPELLPDLRRVSALALPGRLSETLPGAPVELETDLGTAETTLAEGERLVPTAGPTRYLDLGLIGMGGMGEVRRVRDLELHRVVAMKTVRSDVVSPGLLARFVEEVQTTAQLQHPGIVPVYDCGRMEDGSAYFTMKEVRGQDLSTVIRAVHQASRDRWDVTTDGWSLRRLVNALHQASQAVGYAHERGVVHRDLKPSNVMVGLHGEVLVMDWGLAKVRGRADLLHDEVVVRPSRQATRVGRVLGTPAYMAPEQARGAVDELDRRTDVYSLGAMLYEVLTGRPPYLGASGAEVLAQVLSGPPPSPSLASRAGPASPPTFDPNAPPTSWSMPDAPAGGAALPLPEELVQACERAMSRDPGDRHPSAAAFADALLAWLDGSRRREQALEVIARAERLEREADALVQSASLQRAEAATLLEGLAPWEPEERKAPGWAKADQAKEVEVAANLHQILVDQALRGALQLVPDLPEAHAALARRLLVAHRQAEAERGALTGTEALLREHAQALPERHALRREVATYLAGDGALTLVTDPPGAEVLLFRYVLRHRRLVETFDRSLGRTPLRAVSLPMGSWLAVVRREGREEVRYPFEITRNGHWDGIAPGEVEPRPVWLPPAGFLGPREAYLPAGWFRAGANNGPVRSFPALRAWCDARVIHRFPLTNLEYLAFLDDLVAQGRQEEAFLHQPLGAPRKDNTGGEPIYGFDGRRFFLQPDADGDVYLPEWPVACVDWHGARAYLAWLRERTGRGWRLPSELEWEKAARGVDGRSYPWGEGFDASWCRVLDSLRGREHGDAGPAVVDSYPVDCSPFGVRGMGGNVWDWCLDLFGAPAFPVQARVVAPDPGPSATSKELRATRGGSWYTGNASALSTYRYGYGPEGRNMVQGFRGICDVEPTDP